MVSLKVEYNAKEFQVFNRLRDFFPEFKASTLGYVGHEGKLRLKKILLTSDLNFRSVDTDSKGRPIVSYAIGKNASFVRIGSYPMHLFENGRRLRSGRKEQGRKLITKKLRSLMDSDLQGILNQYDRTILQKELDKMA